MKRISLVLLTALGLLGLLAPASIASPHAAAHEPASSHGAAKRGDHRLAKHLDDLLAEGAPAAVAFLRTPEERIGLARGDANVRTGRNAKPDDRYRIGSITKTMTATVVLQLVEEGKLRLDEPVVTYLPDLADLGLDSRITVRHLLQHTSGLSTDTMLWREPDAYVKNRFRTFTPKQLVRIALTYPDPRPEPGTSWEYSNTNYIIAGMLIERVTGNSVRTEFERRIFRPLRMNDTTLPRSNPFVLGRHLHGYLPGEPPTDTTVYNPSWAWTAGAVISTTRDVTTFFRGLFDGRLLPPGRLAEMTQVNEAGYGLGIFRVDLPCGQAAYGHDGIIFGYQTISLTTADGSRQVTIGINTWLQNADGTLKPHVVIAAMQALCGT
ncbi:MAG TPA: serine hydrolase domain-containing protein [Actinopolymorphaceae bacterium]